VCVCVSGGCVESGQCFIASHAYRRLRCLLQAAKVLRPIDVSHQALVRALIREVVFCTKEPGARTRAAAFELLMVLVDRLSAVPAESGGGVGEALKEVSLGLSATTAHARSATVLAMSRVLYEWRRNADVWPILPAVLRAYLVLLKDPTREVVRAVLGLLKVIVVTVPDEVLEGVVDPIMTAMMRGSENKTRLRAKISRILRTLVERMGVDRLRPLVPTADQRLLTKLRRAEARRGEKRSVAFEERKAERSRKRRGSFDELLSGGESEEEEDAAEESRERAPQVQFPPSSQRTLLSEGACACAAVSVLVCVPSCAQ
jgi:ribosomal RNA-processing protein 12